jgi:tetratricopeptide (TPR) repeat protein
MNIQKLKFIFIIFIFLFSSCSLWTKSVNNNIASKEESLTNNYTEIISGNKEVLLKNFSDITSTWNLEILNQYLKNENFEEIQETVSSILKDFKNTKDLSKDENLKLQALKYIQVWAILNEWNFYYKESDKSKEALDLINEINIENPDYVDPFYSNYYLWYAKEISKDYSWALNHYEIALKSAPDIEKNKKLRALILNQIWHLYDLKWDLEKAYTYYQDSYKLDNKNYYTSSNIARYLYKNWKYNESKNFYEYSLLTPNKSLRAEVLFSLSSIELELNWLKPDINKSIEYAKLSVESYADYPMWYLALARWYYMLNDKKYYWVIDENLKKSIELNPNWFEAYKYFWLFEFDKWNLDLAKDYIDKSSKASDKDMILMDNQRESVKEVNNVLKLFLDASYSDKDSFYSFIQYKDLNTFTHMQLKRNNYWIYWFLKDDENFKKTLSWIVK